MAFTPFHAALGTRQGRLTPVGFQPTSGDFAFVLGSDSEGDVHDFAIGDHAEVQQAADLTSENFVRARVRLRNATVVPAGVNWEASITVGGVKKATMLLAPSRSRDRADMAANVSKLSGIHTVGLRLELVGA